MNIGILLLAAHASTKAGSIGIISFPLTVFSVFMIKTCTNFSPTFSEQAKN